ncbi:glycosyltransferase family 1 protein [Diaminobutyricibacter sp. McL0608]|uniref:glycosyltransferase family 1 protein n=1 Tax=Leifsonia sp. McL0608 TaxID=3143537 RepID=UPI0031F30CAA
MPTRPSLLILSFSPIRSDPRVLKQVQLFAPDFDVTTCGFGPAPDGVVEHIEIPRDARAWVDDKVSIATRRYSRAYWNIKAVADAQPKLQGRRFDGILANDLNAVPLALSLNPVHGVHGDLHEFAPREKDDNLQWRLMVAPFMRWLCRTYLKQLTSITTVARGIADQYEADYGVTVGVVTNAAPYAARDPKPVHSPIRLIHSAAGQRYRKLENFIELMKDAPANVTLDMIVMPNEPDYVAELKTMGAGVPGLTFRDPVPYAQLVETLADYDISMTFLPPTNFNLAHALPNKFFEAVQARLGLIIGPSPEMVAILEQYGLGAVVPDFSVESLRAVVAGLTSEGVAQWKRAADAAAHDLSAEAQNAGWTEAIRRLFATVQPS